MTTILHLEFPDFDKKYYNSIEVNSQVIKISNIFIDIKINKIINRERYIETIKLFNNNNNDYVKHKINIYIKKKNNFYCFISSKYGFTFEILNFDKKKLISDIKIKQDDEIYNINICDNNGLKYCRRFNIINCSKDSFDKDIFKIPSFLTEGSYSIDIFYNKISIEKLKEAKYYEINFENITYKDNLLNLEAKVKEIYKKLINDNLDINTKNKIFENEFEQISYSLEDSEFKEFKHLKEILACKREIYLNETEYNICYGYILFNIFENIKDRGFIFYKLVFNIINDLRNNLSNNLDILRILIWYNENYLKDTEFKRKVRVFFAKNKEYIDNDEQINSLNDFKLIYPKKCKVNTPYKKSYDFLYKFIDELNEDSDLLEILYLLDSDSASNRIYTNVRILQLSLLSLSQIKEHLKLLIPNVIIRKFHSNRDESNSDYFHKYGTLVFYEGTLYEMSQDELDSILINKEDNECKYTIPLIMLFFHELFGHIKHRLDNNCSPSPCNYYNPYDNYNLCYHCFLGEEGRLLEFYISPNIDIIKYLKFGFFPNKELFSPKLWASKDLNELRRIVMEKIKKYNFKSNKILGFFPDGLEDKRAIIAKGDKNEVYLTDNANDYYDNDGNITPYSYSIYIREKYSCL